MKNVLLHMEAARRRKGLTLEELSAITRIAVYFLSLLENGRCIPTDDQAQRIAEALEIDAATLLKPVVDFVMG